MFNICMYMCVHQNMYWILPYKQFMLKVHGFNEDGTYGYNIIYVDTM